MNWRRYSVSLRLQCLPLPPDATGAGLRDGDAVVILRDGGGRAALAAAAAPRAGYGNVRAYYLSFADWARDESCSLVRG